MVCRRKLVHLFPVFGMSVEVTSLWNRKKLVTMEWRKPSATRLDKTTNPVARALFNPTEKTTAKGMSISDFLERLSLISPTSVVLKEMREKESKPSSHQSSDELLPKPIRQLAEESATCEQFLVSLPSLSVEDRRKIEEKTRGQSKCRIWYTQREGSLTASMFRDVYTKIDREQNGGSVCLASVLSRILGETAPPSDLPDLKYGRRMESLVITRYVQILKESGHKKVTCFLTKPPQPRRKKRPKKVSQRRPEFFCGVYNLICEEMEERPNAEPSILCDSCSL